MAKPLTQRQLLAAKLDTLSDSEVQEVLEYVTIMESMHRNNVATSGAEDEVIALLADAAENRRARQAFEWETVRRRAERRASANPDSPA